MRRREKKRALAIFSLVMILILVSILSLLFGSVLMTPSEVWYAISCKAQGICGQLFTTIVIWEIRIPRITTAALVGLLLAISGTILQGVLRNPLADPYILGTSAGGAVGAAIAITFGLDAMFGGIFTVPLLAFVFALLAVFVVYNLARTGGGTSPETLILSGVAVSAFCAAVLSLIIIFGGNLQSIYFWLLGGFTGASWDVVISLLPYVIIGSVIAYFYSKDLNALMLGEEMAHTLGIEVEKVRIILLILASFMTAAAVSASGLIGFVGLIVPHFIRLIVGPHYRLLIPLSALSGMLLMVVADTIARSIIPPVEIPVGIVMALIGAPFFLFLLRRKRSNRI
jgi:iron complex transport system permease protein